MRQVSAAHARRPPTDVIGPGRGAGPTAAVAAPTAAATIFSYLGLGSRNSDSDDVSSAGAGNGGDAAAAAVRGVSRGATGAGEALLNHLRLAKERFGSSLEQLFFDGIAEGLPGWPTGRVAGVLMTLALLQRHPDDAWLAEYWPVSRARLAECTAADLAMLSFGVCKLQLQPPAEWTAALLAATQRIAEAPPPPPPLLSPATTEAEATTSGLEGGAGSEDKEGSWGTSMRLTLQRLTGNSGQQRQLRTDMWLGSSSSGAGAGMGHAAGRRMARLLPPGLRKLLQDRSSWGGAGDAAEVPSDAAARDSGSAATSASPRSTTYGRDVAAAQMPWLPASAAARAGTGAQDGGLGSSSGSTSSGGGDVAAACRPINSAYDMEDIFPGAGAETSSSIAGLVLEPMQALWDGVARAGTAVSAAWRRSRSGSELVTVAYNLTAAGLPVEAEWLARFLEVRSTGAPGRGTKGGGAQQVNRNRPCCPRHCP